MYNVLKSRNNFLALFILIGLASCSKSGSNSTTSNNNNTTTNPSGTWIVSSYTQHSENKTSLFSGYTFTFANGGVFTATNNGAMTNGTWSYTAASSGGYYGGSATNATYTFNMGTKDPLNLLNRTWDVSSASASSIALVNPQPTEGEQITFSKQ